MARFFTLSSYGKLAGTSFEAFMSTFRVFRWGVLGVFELDEHVCYCIRWRSVFPDE
jgi:hypothetical protein